jgi:hypothetical protein
MTFVGPVPWGLVQGRGSTIAERVSTTSARLEDQGVAVWIEHRRCRSR